MGRLRSAVLAGATAVALVASTPLASSAAPAAPVSAAGVVKAVDKYYALDGSGTHLLFAAKKTAKTFTEAQAIAAARKYVLNAGGHRAAVPAGYSAFLVGDDPLFRKQEKAVDGTTVVRWIRPERGTSGQYALPEASTIVAPAPNGWIIETPVGGGTYGQAYQLRRVTTDGTLTDLGVPLPDGKQLFVGAGPSGLLIADPTDGGDYASAGTLQFMPWSKPGSYTQIYPAAGAVPQLGTPISCGGSSSTLIRCVIGADEATQIRLIPLDGSKSQLSEEKCALNPAVRTFAIAWIDQTTANGCKAGRVEQRTTEGRLTVSSRRYYRLEEPVAAFGKLVVATSTQRSLVTISNPNSAPTHIVGH